jgi:hypothetical protein
MRLTARIGVLVGQLLLALGGLSQLAAERLAFRLGPGQLAAQVRQLSGKLLVIGRRAIPLLFDLAMSFPGIGGIALRCLKLRLKIRLFLPHLLQLAGRLAGRVNRLGQVTTRGIAVGLGRSRAVQSLLALGLGDRQVLVMVIAVGDGLPELLVRLVQFRTKLGELVPQRLTFGGRLLDPLFELLAGTMGLFQLRPRGIPLADHLLGVTAGGVAIFFGLAQVRLERFDPLAGILEPAVLGIALQTRLLQLRADRFKLLD